MKNGGGWEKLVSYTTVSLLTVSFIISAVEFSMTQGVWKWTKVGFVKWHYY